MVMALKCHSCVLVSFFTACVASKACQDGRKCDQATEESEEQSLLQAHKAKATDVAALVSRNNWGWDDYALHFVENSAGAFDKAAIFGKDGTAYTDAFSDPTKILDIQPYEAGKLAAAMEYPDTLANSGITADGTKYLYQKYFDPNQDDAGKMIIGRKKGRGGIALIACQTVIAVVHIPEGQNQARANLALSNTDLVSCSLLQGQVARHLQDNGPIPVVIDLGPETVQAGMAGEDEPQKTQTRTGDDLQPFLQDVFDKLKKDPSEQVALVAMSPMSPSDKRQELTQMMFEDFKVPGLYLGNRAMMAALTNGFGTAFVLLVDDTVAYGVAIYERIPLDYATSALDVSDDTASTDLAELVYNMIMRVDDVNVRKEFFAAVVLAGGGASLPEKEKMQTDIADLAPPTMKIRVRKDSSESSVWLGGSILGSLSSFNQDIFTAEDYYTMGPRAVDYLFY